MCTCNCNFVGFGFRPTEEELVFHYLENKAKGHDDLTPAIAEVDLCRHEPWNLPLLERSEAKSNTQVWHFFYQLDHKYRNSQKADRSTEAGYWKITGRGRKIVARDTKEKFATMKSLVFYEGHVPNGVRTNWVIHEYQLAQSVSPPDRGAYVVCRLFKKPPKKNSTPRKGKRGSSSASTHNDAADNALTEGGPQLQAIPELFDGYIAPDNELAMQMQEQGVSLEDPLEPDALSNIQNVMQDHGPFDNDMLPNGFTASQNGWQTQLDAMELGKSSVERNAFSSMILAEGGPKLQPNSEPLVGDNALHYELAALMQEDPLEPDGLSNYQNGMQYNDMSPNGFFVQQNWWEAQLDTIEHKEASGEMNTCSSVILTQRGPQSQANQEPLIGYSAPHYELPVQIQEHGISLEDLSEPNGFSNDLNGMQENGPFYNDTFSNRFTVEQHGGQPQFYTIEQDAASVERNACSSMILAQGGPWLHANQEPLDGYSALDYQQYELSARMQEHGISLEDLSELDDLSNGQNRMQEHCPFYDVLRNGFTFKQNVEQAQLDTIEQEEEFASSMLVDGDNENSKTETEMSNLRNQPVDSKGSWQNQVDGFNYEDFPNLDTSSDDLVAATHYDPNSLNKRTCKSLNQPRYDNSLTEECPRSFQLQYGFSSQKAVFKDKARDVELSESSFSYNHKSKRGKTHSDENFNNS